MSVKAVISDDETLVRKSVRRFLKGHDVSIIEECEDAATTASAIRRHRPEILFLDMEMPNGVGLSALADLDESNMPVTVIITAHERFAVQAYGLNVVDYILKPFGKERFDKGVERALKRISTTASPERTGAMPVASKVDDLLDQLHRQQQQKGHIPIATRSGSIVLVRPSEIECVEAEESSILIHCRTRTYELRETLSGLHKRLNPSVFLRIHRSTLVNVNYIREIRPWCNGYHVVVLTSGRELRMSRYQSEAVERLLGY